MAFTRHQVATSAVGQHRLFRWANTHKVLSSALPWVVGVIFTSLHFLDLTDLTVTFQAFFDPVSKLTILLPASSNPVNFYAQTGMGAAVSLLTMWYSVRAWVAIDANARSVRDKGMIRSGNGQDHKPNLTKPNLT
jgi:hypothetical protein